MSGAICTNRSEEWVGLVNVTASFNQRSPEGLTGEAVDKLAVNRSSDEAGDVDWGIRELRDSLDAASTYTASIILTVNVSPM
ncbi:hypothetical protein ACHAQF_009002 [Verticillium nonalfalfae]